MSAAPLCLFKMLPLPAADTLSCPSRSLAPDRRLLFAHPDKLKRLSHAWYGGREASRNCIQRSEFLVLSPSLHLLALLHVSSRHSSAKIVLSNSVYPARKQQQGGWTERGSG
eukprot:767197-Hanusia_phi.AAC.1